MPFDSPCHLAVSKICTPNGTLVSGHIIKSPESRLTHLVKNCILVKSQREPKPGPIPGGLILTHTQIRLNDDQVVGGSLGVGGGGLGSLNHGREQEQEFDSRPVP